MYLKDLKYYLNPALTFYAVGLLSRLLPLPLSSARRRQTIKPDLATHHYTHTWQPSLHSPGNPHYAHLATLIAHTWQPSLNTPGNPNFTHVATLLTHTWQPSLHTPGNPHYAHLDSITTLITPTLSCITLQAVLVMFPSLTVRLLFYRSTFIIIKLPDSLRQRYRILPQ